ncbi:hypothetical protein F4819DRAFT_509731 [Hypoxylon fuscum]|nr:hypothetical protein F4819DRAFT_509731 [Hypoxylon fuscum]
MNTQTTAKVFGSAQVVALALLFLSLVSCVSATNPKANEYKSTVCSGEVNFKHASPYLTHVTMDDTSRCVYLAQSDWKTRTWQAYTEKTKDGGLCWGYAMGNLGGEEHNLDTTYEKRISCLLNCGTKNGSSRYDKCRDVGSYTKKEDAGNRGF